MLYGSGIAFILFLAMVVPSGATENKDLPPGTYVVFNTNLGTITCRLFEKEAPNTVANFIGLVEGTKEWLDPKTGEKVKKPFYDGLIFHRIIPNFMIQGGDPEGTGRGGPGYTFADEFSPKLKHDKPGRLSMANAGPHTNGSQFFITLAPTTWLDNRHSIFGEVVEGQDIIDKITKAQRDGNDRPLKEIAMESVKIIRR